ncbi:MAG: MaoC family dehydratase [Burkholderiales bacterium]
MLYFDDISVGSTFQSSSRTILDADIVNFAGLSGDFNRLHVDDVFAATTPFKRRIAHGMLVASVVTGLKSKMDDMAVLAFLETSRKFRKPVFPGDTVTANFAVAEMRPSKSRPDTGVIVFSVRVANQQGETVQEGQDIIMFERRAS